MTATAPRLRPAGALRDRLVRIAELSTTPLLPADYLDLVAPLRSGATLRGRIDAVHPETRDAATVVIRPGRDWRTHTPGQYVRVGVDVDGVRHWRAYSLTSATGRPDGRISITVKAVPGGTVSNHLVRRATPGTVVHLEQASGEFTLGATAPAKILFVTAGSGITPVMGMLRNLPRGAADVVVAHSAPTFSDSVFGGELRALAKAGRIRLIERHTATDGRLDAAQLDGLVGDLADRQTWACGPAALLEDLTTHWAARGLAARLHTERFTLATTAAGEGGTVTFSKTGATTEAAGAQSLLDAGEAAGVLMPSGCRMGICFGCVAPLRQGAVRDLRTGEVTTANAGDDIKIQTCVSAAAGTCDIEL